MDLGWRRSTERVSLINLDNAELRWFYCQLDFYAYPCDLKFTVSIVFGGAPFSIDLADFNLGKDLSCVPYSSHTNETTFFQVDCPVHHREFNSHSKLLPPVV